MGEGDGTSRGRVQTAVSVTYLDSMIATFRAGGLSLELTHHALHALGSRLYGFTQEVFDDSGGVDPDVRERMAREMAGAYPHVVDLLRSVYHDEASVVGQGCDDQFEFEFALDLLLDGLDRLRRPERTAGESQVGEAPRDDVRV